VCPTYLVLRFVVGLQRCHRRPPRSKSRKLHRSYPVLRVPAVDCQHVLVLPRGHNVSYRTGIGIPAVEDLIVDLLGLLTSPSTPHARRGPSELWTTGLTLLSTFDRLPVSWCFVLVCRLARCLLSVLYRHCISKTLPWPHQKSAFPSRTEFSFDLWAVSLLPPLLLWDTAAAGCSHTSAGGSPPTQASCPHVPE
jgi:hypothetical protein